MQLHHSHTLQTIHVLFFFNDTATPEIYPLSLHDALPISDPARLQRARLRHDRDRHPDERHAARGRRAREDRKSTRLNSSHANISYAVFCLKKKKIRAAPIRDRTKAANRLTTSAVRSHSTS